MTDLVVASNLEHANALAHWLKLNPETTETLAYGKDVQAHYNDVYLARPVSGVEEAHTQWVLEDLMPRIYGTIIPLSPSWRLAA